MLSCSPCWTTVWYRLYSASCLAHGRFGDLIYMSAQRFEQRNLSMSSAQTNISTSSQMRNSHIMANFPFDLPIGTNRLSTRSLRTQPIQASPFARANPSNGLRCLSAAESLQHRHCVNTWTVSSLMQLRSWNRHATRMYCKQQKTCMLEGKGQYSGSILKLTWRVDVYSIRNNWGFA